MDTERYCWDNFWSSANDSGSKVTWKEKSNMKYKTSIYDLYNFFSSTLVTLSWANTAHALRYTGLNLIYSPFWSHVSLKSRS